jgi:hypothetical protein
MLETFLHGAAAMNSVIIALFFLRFWRHSLDRLFLFFGLAFGMLAIDRAALALVPSATEWRQYVYLVRLLAFTVIICGIVDKNRRR